MEEQPPNPPTDVPQPPPFATHPVEHVIWFQEKSTDAWPNQLYGLDYYGPHSTQIPGSIEKYQQPNHPKLGKLCHPLYFFDPLDLEADTTVGELNLTYSVTPFEEGGELTVNTTPSEFENDAEFQFTQAMGVAIRHGKGAGKLAVNIALQAGTMKSLENGDERSLQDYIYYVVHGMLNGYYASHHFYEESPYSLLPAKAIARMFIFPQLALNRCMAAETIVFNALASIHEDRHYIIQNPYLGNRLETETYNYIKNNLKYYGDGVTRALPNGRQNPDKPLVFQEFIVKLINEYMISKYCVDLRYRARESPAEQLARLQATNDMPDHLGITLPFSHGFVLPCKGRAHHPEFVWCINRGIPAGRPLSSLPCTTIMSYIGNPAAIKDLQSGNDRDDEGDERAAKQPRLA